MARDPVWPVKAVGLNPDPLASFAYAFQQVQHDLGESAEVHFDLLPVTRASVLRRRRRTTNKRGRGAEKDGSSNRGGILDGLLLGMGVGDTSQNPRRTAVGVARLDELGKERSVVKALTTHDQHFQVQILVRTRAKNKERALILLQNLLPCFEQWGSENYFKVNGIRVAGRYLGSDFLWNRSLFDRRIANHVFSFKRRNQVLSAAQIGGAIKPVTTNCSATNVLRSGGYVPEAPNTLLTFNTNADYMMPWGIVKRGDAERVIGVRLDESFFTWTGGRSRFGKTETSLCRLVHLAKSGHGCLFLDPHADALARAKQHLGSEAKRIIEISVARDGSAKRQVGWNMFSTQGCDGENLDDRAAAIIDGFAAAMSWESTRAPRAISILQNATLSLLELSIKLPDEIAPTFFQLNTILSNDAWREAIQPMLSPSLQAYWTHRFERLPPDAITPITNMLDRLRASPSVASMIGSSKSTYDIRQAMDQGKIVLIRLSGAGATDQLLASLVVFDLLRAVRSRWDLAPSKRRPFHAFMDEVQSYDGSVKGLLGAALEEGAKFGLRLHLMNQQPTSLSKRTLGAVLTNRSHLMTTNLNADSSRLLVNEWQGAIEPGTIQDLGKYQFITQVTDQGTVSAPFRASGLSLDAMYGPGATKKELAKLEQSIDRNSGCRPVNDILDELNQLDQRILDHITTTANVVPITSNARFSHSGQSEGTKQ